MLFPFLGRLSITDYIIVILVYIESIVSFVLKLIPQPMFNLFEWLINFTTCSDDNTIEQKLRAAPTIHEMCALFDISVEDHLVRTEDNYILTLHRIPPISKNKFNNKVVYLHHGLLMCSDVWCCNVERHKNLPFVLHDLGYDVWMGNNRGNKYSTAHLNKPPKSSKFWDFSIDEFAFFDIPNSIEFILDITRMDKVICIGFSQGSAQMFAAFSLSEKLNQKVSHFIAIAPAMTPRGLHNRIVDALAKSSPSFMYLFFGRNIVLPSAVIWQRTLHPTLFNFCIDVANKVLFNWKSFNIQPRQKIASYAKLYSTTSVKSIVHWFQILRSQKFQMFEASDSMLNSLTRPYQIASFPTRTNIKIPILLIYGGIDSLVDIEVMKRNLPSNSVFDVKVDNYEHLDLIWGKDTDTLVIAKVLRFIEFFNPGNSLMKTSHLLPSASLVEEVPTTAWKAISHPSRDFSQKVQSLDRSPLSVQADEVDEKPSADNARFLRRVFSTSAIDEDNSNVPQEETEGEIHKEQQRRLSAYLESSNDLRQLDTNISAAALDGIDQE